jgi:hypothetical protein
MSVLLFMTSLPHVSRPVPPAAFDLSLGLDPLCIFITLVRACIITT